ncbi:peptidylprolyl isomerase/foldase protein PrsA [Sinobaca qinghaiensis]|uniref:Foldase protein PrsA n=1 Tax=Sinobaca qinghaiensis TaxID=342944 RepID=A0A419V3N9_9BACL|nr:peptidylprolyl isomerase [Sinobaca qinghaiensis]RKD73137.1 peptidylprolyl isomerase/foldase protein PrsA [Sinobaca qinghaiensis]
MKKELFAILGTSGLLFLAGCNDNEEQSSDNSQTVVQVNDREITEEEFTGELKNTYGSQVFNDMVQSALIEEQAEEMEITDERLNEELADFKEQVGVQEDEELLTLMENQLGVQIESIDDFKEDYLKPQVVVYELAEADVEVTEEDKEAYFEENQEDLESANARHILVEDEETAEEAVSRLDDGESFEDVATDMSTDPGSAEQGGDLGFFTRGQMVPEFDEAVFSMEEGEVSEPIESEFGFHIIELIEIRDTYEELEGDIEEALRQEQRLDETEVMQNLMEEANINVEEPSYEDWLDMPAEEE